LPNGRKLLENKESLIGGNCCKLCTFWKEGMRRKLLEERQLQEERKLLEGIAGREEIADVNEMLDVRGWQKEEGGKKKKRNAARGGISGIEGNLQKGNKYLMLVYLYVVFVGVK
jgi:hypothetical protein